MSDIELQSYIAGKLTELAVGQAEIAVDMSAVKTHLEKLNSKVASHEKELNERRNSCPLVLQLEVRVRALEDSNTSRIATDSSNGHWMTRLWPFFWALCGVIGFLILAHGQEILQHGQTVIQAGH